MTGLILRIGAFFFYCLLFFILPFGVLWTTTGIAISLFLWACFLLFMGLGANNQIQKRMGTRPIAESEHPVLFALTREHCRRLEIPVPNLLLLDTQAINSACFGLSQQNAYLVVTQGLLASLTREELSAIIAQQCVAVWHRDMVGPTWLSQFLAILGKFTGPAQKRISFKDFLMRLVLYPLALVPTYLLTQKIPTTQLDRESIKISRHPFELAAALKKMDAYYEKRPLMAKFSILHLFQAWPKTLDPIVNLVFKPAPLKTRISFLSGLNRVSVPS